MNNKITKEGASKHNIELVLQYYKENLDLRDMLRSKKLTASFCREIILDEDDKYAIGVEDTFITKKNILENQKHLILYDLELQLEKNL